MQMKTAESKKGRKFRLSGPMIVTVILGTVLMLVAILGLTGNLPGVNDDSTTTIDANPADIRSEPQAPMVYDRYGELAQRQEMLEDIAQMRADELFAFDRLGELAQRQLILDEVAQTKANDLSPYDRYGEIVQSEATVIGTDGDETVIYDPDTGSKMVVPVTRQTGRP